MRPFIAFILVFFNLPLAEAQINLIPNHSFEDTIGCPINLSGQYGEQIYNLQYWFPAANSPDYFNSCSNSQVSTPLTGLGFQYPRSGEGYIGFLTILSNSIFFPNYHEFIGIELNQSLIVGTKYYFKSYISPGYGGIQLMHYFSNNIGVKLSTVYYEAQQNMLFPDNNPTGNLDTIITDTTNWTSFQFSFVADSSYQYLYIGNFFDDANTDTILAFGNTSGQGAYYFMDDVCLSSDSNYCDLILKTVNFEREQQVVFPNPTFGHLHFKNILKKTTVKIFDMIGVEVREFELNPKNEEIDIAQLPSGIYLIRTDNLLVKPIIVQKL